MNPSETFFGQFELSAFHPADLRCDRWTAGVVMEDA
jgi:hypothetical protein